MWGCSSSNSGSKSGSRKPCSCTCRSARPRMTAWKWACTVSSAARWHVVLVFRSQHSEPVPVAPPLSHVLKSFAAGIAKGPLLEDGPWVIASYSFSGERRSPTRRFCSTVDGCRPSASAIALSVSVPSKAISSTVNGRTCGTPSALFLPTAGIPHLRRFQLTVSRSRPSGLRNHRIVGPEHGDLFVREWSQVGQALQSSLCELLFPARE